MQTPRQMTDPAVTNPAVFVGGCPRSGTTLLQRMLNSHPELVIVNDSHFIPRVLQKTDSRSYDAAASGEAVPLTDEIVDAIWDYHRFYRFGTDRATLLGLADGCATYQQLVARLFEDLRTRQGKKFAGEKTPDYVRHAPMLLRHFSRVTFDRAGARWSQRGIVTS